MNRRNFVRGLVVFGVGTMVSNRLLAAAFDPNDLSGWSSAQLITELDRLEAIYPPDLAYSYHGPALDFYPGADVKVSNWEDMRGEDWGCFGPRTPTLGWRIWINGHGQGLQQYGDYIKFESDTVEASDFKEAKMLLREQAQVTFREVLWPGRYMALPILIYNAKVKEGLKDGPPSDLLKDYHGGKFFYHGNI